MQDQTEVLLQLPMVARMRCTGTDRPWMVLGVLGTGLVGSAEVSKERRKKVICTQLAALRPHTAADSQIDALITQLLQLNDNPRLDSADRAVIGQEAVAPTTRPCTGELESVLPTSC